MSDYYFEDLSPFDEAVESFKEELRGAVKHEVQTEMETLRTQNREMAEKLKNLGQLEQAAERARIHYEVQLSQAESTARRTVEKEGIRKLLSVLREPRYRIVIERDWQPKCDRCDEDRRLHYTTPRGKASYEQCECSVTTPRYAVEEALVHEVAKRNGELLAWYHEASRYFSDDSFGSPTVLNAPAKIEEMMKDPRSYGFPSMESAQALADAMNEAAS
jgi:hypothetical protein